MRKRSGRYSPTVAQPPATRQTRPRETLTDGPLRVHRQTPAPASPCFVTTDAATFKLPFSNEAVFLVVCVRRIESWEHQPCHTDARISLRQHSAGVTLGSKAAAK